MNPSTTTLDLNVGYPSVATICHAVQGDIQARIITANLYDGGVKWVPPSGAIGTIRFRTPLGTSGFYDTDEEGNIAVTWVENVATLRIVQNAIAVAGDVPMQLSFYDGNGQVLTTFLWETLVQPSVLTDTKFMQTDYYNLLSKQINALIGAAVYPPIINPTTRNWMLWDTETNSYVDSGYSSVGAKGDKGDQGISITRIQRTSGTGEAGTNDTYTVYLSDGTTAGTFIVHNGSNGTNGLSIGRIEKTSGTGAAGTTDTYTVYLSNNTIVGTFTVYNGSDGEGSPGTHLPLMDGDQAAVGTAIAYSREDHVHPSDTSRVPTSRTVNGKALSANITLNSEDIGDDSGAGGTNVKESLAALKGSLNLLNGSLREKHIFLMSDSYGVFAAAGGKSWEGYVRDYLVPRGKTVTMNATGGAGFGYQPEHQDYQQCYFPNIIDGYIADSTVDIILILAGANDGNLLFASATSEALIKAGIATSVTKLRTKFPNASIHIGFVGRYRTSNRFTSYKTARDIYKNACAENGIAFADNFEYILHNRNMINSTDLVHPTLAGSELIGKYAVEYIMRKGISVIYEDVYTIAATNTWFDWTGKKLKVKVCNETTFVTLLSSTNAYEFSFGPIQNIPVGVMVNTNETLTTEQFLLDTSILTDSTLLLFALWLNADGTTNMTLPSRVAFTQSGIFMTTVKPYAATYPTESTLKVINSYTAFDTMLT